MYDQFADLKQFIAATISQATAHLATKDDLVNLKDEIESRVTGLHMEMDARFEQVDARFGQLENKIDQRFDDLEAKVDAIADAHAETLEDYGQRLGALEQAA